MDSINLVRIDDGVRAKLVCSLCRAETYVSLIPDGPRPVEDVVHALNGAMVGHRQQCRQRVF